MDATRLRSVRHKLLLMVLVANFFTLMAAGATLFYHDLRDNRTKMANELGALADIVGLGNVAALEFDDAKVANENLAQLRSNPNIVAAAIYTAQGALFAQYVRDGEARAGGPANRASQRNSTAIPDGPGPYRFSVNGGDLTLFKAIDSQQNPVGTVYLKKSYDLSKWIRDYLIILGSVMLASLGLGLIISSRLQRWISGPIQEVSTVARQVMEQRNYQLRATKTTEDEIGQLADAFNGMLQTLEHEIAERTLAEQTVRSLNEKLEQRVSDRTAELQIANQTLVTRTDEAESANRTKANFLANMSHEIRTPMNGILGLAYLLEQSNLDENSADLVKKIRNAGRSLQSIINDILDFSKIEAGRLEIEHVPFRIADVLDNLSGIMAANAGGKDIEMLISPAPPIGGQLLGDVLRLEQVLINLTGNAIKFTEGGSIVVGISLLARDDKIAKLRFSVKDSGIGISFEKQQQIFDAFSQADVSTTRRFGGTGLGLTICRHLVTRMGGEIGVISEAGKGSEFWFTIPFEWCAGVEYAPPEMVGLDVLIVDDSEIARENLALTAQSVGWKPTKVESGEAAIQKLSTKYEAMSAFNVLLVDWKMPGMDGLEVAAKVHSTFKGEVAPIVLMVTAFARDELLKQPNIDLVDGILNKPVTSSSLYNTVAEVLRRRGKGGLGGLHSSFQSVGKRIPDVRVLVVDDSEINREVVMRILVMDGAVVDTVNDGQAALDWLHTNPDAIDIVLMDVQMPVMDGYEATRRLRALPEFANLPIVALTAGAFKTQQDAAQKAGMNAFVAKPFNVEELITTIQKLTHCVPELTGKSSTEQHSASTAANSPHPSVTVSKTLHTDSTNLSGIDVVQGLSVWKELAAYQKFLLIFSTSYADSAERLGNYYLAKNYEAASALLHKLKGAAGNLALTEVARLAAELEAVDVSHDINEALDHLRQALDIAVSSIAVFTAADPEQVSESPESANASRAAPLLTKLMGALDTDAPDQANQLLDDLIPVLPLASLSPLRSCVDNFDFRGAENLVRSIAKQLGIKVEE
ncbi:MAG: response regulator [Pseudomonadota bacterium]